MQRDQNSVVELQELPGQNGDLFERSPKFGKEATNRLGSAVSAGNRILIWRYQLEVRPRIMECGIPVSAAYRFVYGAKRLNVCLRHRVAQYPAGSGEVGVSVVLRHSPVRVSSD